MDWELLILLITFAACFFGIGYIQGKKRPPYYVDCDCDCDEPQHFNVETVEELFREKK